MKVLRGKYQKKTKEIGENFNAQMTIPDSVYRTQSGRLVDQVTTMPLDSNILFPIISKTTDHKYQTRQEQQYEIRKALRMRSDRVLLSIR